MSGPTTFPRPAADGKIVLILPRMQGFFSLVFQAVGQAHLAAQAGATPVVYFNRHCPYWSDAGCHGARNVWDYFFEPLSPLTAEEILQRPASVLENFTPAEFETLCAGTRITPTTRYPAVVEYKSPIGICFERKFVHGLLEKYAILKPHVLEKVDEFCRIHFTSPHILGVHYRGIEKAHGQVKDWVVSRQVTDLKDHFFTEIRRRFARRPGAQIFIATDSAQFLDDARNEFGDAVISRDATRLARDEEAVGLHFSDKAKSVGHLLGEEVLLDALILARTNFLVHGVSNVSNAALFFNPRLAHFDVEVRRGRTAVYVKREFYRQLGRVSPRFADGLQRLETRLRG